MENFDLGMESYARTRIKDRLREARQPRLPQPRRRRGMGRRYRDTEPESGF